MKQTLRNFTGLVILVSTLMVLGCTNSTIEAERDQLLRSSILFPGSGVLGDDEMNGGGGKQPSCGDECPEGGLPAQLICEEMPYSMGGSTLLGANTGVTAHLYPKEVPTSPEYLVTGSPIKSFGVNAGPSKEEIRQDLINRKQLRIPLNDLAPLSQYIVKLCDFARESSCLKAMEAEMGMYGVLNYEGMKDVIEIQTDGTGRVISKKGEIEVLYLLYWNGQIVGGGLDGDNPVDSGMEECDEMRSPLMIDVSRDGLKLSAPLDGMLFDMKGNGSKVLVSKPLSSDDVFLALPKNDLVQSVHQLFGNETIGPDGKKAANGFEALAKYDLHRDGRIDRLDPVFHELRIWVDQNGDGIGKGEELTPLASHGVQSIDLNYVQIMEKDVYQNETRQRSAVSSDKGLLLIFDVWFRLLPASLKNQK